MNKWITEQANKQTSEQSKQVSKKAKKQASKKAKKQINCPDTYESKSQFPDKNNIFACLLVGGLFNKFLFANNFEFESVSKKN